MKTFTMGALELNSMSHTWDTLGKEREAQQRSEKGDGTSRGSVLKAPYNTHFQTFIFNPRLL